MQSAPTTRTSRPGQIALAAVVLCALTLSGTAHAGMGPRGAREQGNGAGNSRPAPPAQPRGNQARPNQQFQNRPNNAQQHLGEWMNSHRGQPLVQQQKALEQEPGFRQLQPDVQQKMRDRLTQLNGMTPERRQQVINRTEAMERLNPAQRQQVRNAAGQLGSLPEDRRRAVARAFHDLREMPSDQRQNYMNSPQFRSQFSDQERGTVNNLLEVSPYLPMQQRQAAPSGPPPLY